jgi:signal transduction histidine kinase
LNVELEVSGELDLLPERHRTCVYRSVQEALTNCVRHAKAERVRVAVSGRGGALDVSVEDDGVGIRAARRGDGLGLRGIEERVRELGGVMNVVGEEGAGTRLSFRLPMTLPEVPCAGATG